jgi:hypothetical protein
LTDAGKFLDPRKFSLSKLRKTYPSHAVSLWPVLELSHLIEKQMAIYEQEINWKKRNYLWF